MKSHLRFMIAAVVVSAMAQGIWTVQGVSASAAAAPAYLPPEGQVHGPDNCTVCAAHKPGGESFDWLTLDGDIRFRWIYQKNPFLTKHPTKDGAPRGTENNFQRIRTRLWATITPPKMEDKVKFNIGVDNEWRNYIKPVGGRGRYDRDVDLDEVIISQLNVQLIDLFDLNELFSVGESHWELTIGRQNIYPGMKGSENTWLFGDGAVLSGTRSFFFDAVRARVELTDLDSTVDLVYLNTAADPSDRLKPINDQDALLTLQDNQGVIVYVAHKLADDTQIDGYFAYKRNDRTNHIGVSGDIYTVGIKAQGRLTDHVKYQAEVAPQSGTKAGTNINTLGALGELAYAFNDLLDNELYTTYEYRGGGKTPAGNFDMLWGSWGTWGYAVPDRLTTNMHRAAVGWRGVPLTTVNFDMNYQLLFVDRSNVTNSAISGDGCLRGQLVTGTINQKISEHFSHQIRAEVFVPGDYYTDNNNDTTFWTRYQLLFQW